MQHLFNIIFIILLHSFLSCSVLAASAEGKKEQINALYASLRKRIKDEGYDKETEKIVTEINTRMHQRNNIPSDFLDGEQKKTMAEYLLSLKQYKDAAEWYIAAYRTCPPPYSIHELKSYLYTINKEKGVYLFDLLRDKKDQECIAILQNYWKGVDEFMSTLLDEPRTTDITASGKKPGRVELSTSSTYYQGAKISSFYKALDVAHDIIKLFKDDPEFTNLKLQKIMYICQGCYSACFCFHSPLFE